MGLPTSESEKSDQWSNIGERHDPRNGIQPHYGCSHDRSSANCVTAGNKLWTPECASWATWLLSSFAMSVFFTLLMRGRPLDLIMLGSGHPLKERPETTIATTTEPILLRRPPPERRGICKSGGSDAASSYNLPLRVGALFIILAVSSAACAFPILVTRLPGLRIPDNFFFAVRHFGTGVLIATAFVHLLPTAFTLLGDPCLGRFWTDDFEAMPGAVALVGIFVVTVIEMLLHPARRTAVPAADGEEEKAASGGGGSHFRGAGQEARRRPLGKHRSHFVQYQHSTPKKNAEEDMEDAEAGLPAGPPTITDYQKHRKDIMQIVLLEMGILFHSVFIGMALSVSIGGNEFVVLLIAIAFHRKICLFLNLITLEIRMGQEANPLQTETFEGLALGARIAAIEWPEKSLQPIFMAVAYGCTTPVGQAIGLAARSAYSPESEFGLILVGLMNAISAGLLTFASLVELLSEDLLSDESWRILRGRRRVCAFLLVVAGAFLMSLVGAWA
ncbi:Zinc/iron permease [Apiospora phragmitis]|uniref:Zinc/iron permease n=1 Tax=Apiospora phragmitis TaxID=2905665 RepID=A0ABR1VC65_9PEZI